MVVACATGAQFRVAAVLNGPVALIEPVGWWEVGSRGGHVVVTVHRSHMLVQGHVMDRTKACQRSGRP